MALRTPSPFLGVELAKHENGYALYYIIYINYITYVLDISKMTEMTEAWATKTKGILIETVNMQKNEAAQEAKGTF